MSAAVGFDCPVCFEPYDELDRSRVVWPCGHAVCTRCDADMATNGLHMCPTCRTPRAGMSAAEATHHAEQARLRDAQEEAGYGDVPSDWRDSAWGAYTNAFPANRHDDEPEPGAYTYYRAQMLPSRRPANEVLVFPNQAQGGGPAAMLMELEQAVRSTSSWPARMPPPARPPQPQPPGALSEGEQEPRDGFNGLAVLLRGLVYPAGEDEEERHALPHALPRARAVAAAIDRQRALRAGQLHDSFPRPGNRRFRLADADHPRHHQRPPTGRR